MKNLFSATKNFLARYINRYRLAVGLGFIAATALVLSARLPMPEVDDWAFYYGVQNFSHGQLTIDNSTYYLEAFETSQHGSILLQYLPIAKNKWALEKAPGSVFYLVPFYKMGIPRAGNVLLALGMVIVTYILLKRLRDEKAAMIGSLLILFTPVALVMCNRIYMDSYSSLAFLTMGGGLYIFYHLEKERLSAWKGGTVLFLAFLFIGWSVVCRYTNLPVAVILFLHWAVTRITALYRHQPTRLKTEIIPLVLGIGIPMASLFLYDYFIFGSVLKTGYSISPYPIKFAFQYWRQIDVNGKLIPGEILTDNLQGATRNTLLGFPLLAIGIPGFFVILYQKFFRRRVPEGKWSSLRRELPWDIVIMLACWFLSLLCVYLLYEWTAGLWSGGGFILFNRMYLPWLLPIVIVCALIMARFPGKILIPLLLITIAWGGMLFTQWAWDLHVLPAWLTSSVYKWTPWMFKRYYHPM